MKLEIKKDMYIRTKDGIIDKVIVDYNGHCVHPTCEYKHISCARHYYCEDEIKKVSYNIIDLIEVGDFVNGYEVGFVDKENKIIICYTATFEKKDIKTIVSKEQFEQITYKVGA